MTAAHITHPLDRTVPIDDWACGSRSPVFVEGPNNGEVRDAPYRCLDGIVPGVGLIEIDQAVQAQDRPEIRVAQQSKSLVARSSLE